MKLLGVLFLLSFSTAIFAQHVVDCKLTINTNKTKKDLKELRESSVERRIELFEGQDHSEVLKINRLIAYPGEKKTDKYLIRVFEEDKRESAISKEKDVAIERMSSAEKVNFSVTHHGTKTIVTVKTNNGHSRLNFKGVGMTSKKSFVAYSKFQYLKKDKPKVAFEPLVITCQMLPKEIIDESEIKKGEVNSLDEEKAIHEKYKAKQE